MLEAAFWGLVAASALVIGAEIASFCATARCSAMPALGTMRA